jgi:hypothetical protein
VRLRGGLEDIVGRVEQRQGQPTRRRAIGPGLGATQREA